MQDLPSCLGARVPSLRVKDERNAFQGAENHLIVEFSLEGPRLLAPGVFTYGGRMLTMASISFSSADSGTQFGINNGTVNVFSRKFAEMVCPGLSRAQLTRSHF